jgi:hypothetical protein
MYVLSPLLASFGTPSAWVHIYGTQQRAGAPLLGPNNTVDLRGSRAIMLTEWSCERLFWFRRG